MVVSLTDEELIFRSNGKRNIYYEMLVDRYLKIYPKIVHSVAQELMQKYIDHEEYLFEFYETFEKAFSKYEKGKGKFYSYFKMIFYRRIKKAILKFINSNDGLDHYISLSDEVGEGVQVIDMIADSNADDPVSYYRTSGANLLLRETSSLGKTTKANIRYKAILLRAKGLTYAEIAKKLNISYSSVRRLTKAKNDPKLKDIYLELK